MFVRAHGLKAVDKILNLEKELDEDVHCPIAWRNDMEILSGPLWEHYGDFIMGTIASQITSLTVVYSTVYSDAVQRNHQSSASLAFVWGIHRGPVKSPHKWLVTRKCFPFDNVIMGIHHSPLDFPLQRASNASLDVFFNVSLNILLNKECVHLRFETPWRRWCDVTVMELIMYD